MPLLECPLAPDLREISPSIIREIERDPQIWNQPAESVDLKTVEDTKAEENYQDLCWLTQYQVLIEISKMGDGHLGNTINMLITNKYNITVRPGYLPDWTFVRNFTRMEWIDILQAEAASRGIEGR